MRSVILNNKQVHLDPADETSACALHWSTAKAIRGMIGRRGGRVNISGQAKLRLRESTARISGMAAERPFLTNCPQV
jgi:hypothetical protein